MERARGRVESETNTSSIGNGLMGEGVEGEGCTTVGKGMVGLRGGRVDEEEQGGGALVNSKGGAEC